MAKNYNTRTASLKATIADVRVLDAKEMSLNGKNILDYISESEFDSYDTRDPQLKNDELDIWNTAISLSDNGHIEVKPHVHNISVDVDTEEITLEGVTESQNESLRTAVKVINNKVLGANDEHIMYWQTDGLMDGEYMFYGCDNLTTFTSDLSSLEYGYGMFSSCSNLTRFSSDLSNLADCRYMFHNCENLTRFSSDLSNLADCSSMFEGCGLTSFNADLSSLTTGWCMFAACGLTSFTSDLSSLTNGGLMFAGCANLTSFSSDLSSLVDGQSMFQYCENLTTFSSDLSSLTNGNYMFYNNNLTTFSSDLSNLWYGDSMFWACTNLTSFTSDLSSLTDGSSMFEGCKLDAQSVANIIHFIPQRSAKPTSTTAYGNILIGIGITNTDEAKQAFAEECDCDTWEELNKEFDDKNWAVEWQFNGEATTFDLRSPRPSTAVYAKLEEIFMPSEEEIAAAKKNKQHLQIPHYEYTSQDGSKFYNIHWYHDSNTNNEGYDYFESLEEAISAYSVISKA